jgi:hypothetical protein
LTPATTPTSTACSAAGYGTVLVHTARRRMAGESPSTVLNDRRARLERLYDALRDGVVHGP